MPTVLPDIETCRLYAALATLLEKSGTPIPQNDLWIASLALQHGAALATCDLHFQHVPGLKTENWLA